MKKCKSLSFQTKWWTTSGNLEHTLLKNKIFKKNSDDICNILWWELIILKEITTKKERLTWKEECSCKDTIAKHMEIEKKLINQHIHAVEG